MDKILSNLFNNGSNDGDLTIQCDDNIRIRCHSFVLVQMSEYYKGLVNFNKTDQKNFIKLDYSSKVVKRLFNIIYNSSFTDSLDDFSFEDLVDFLKLVDEILIIDRHDIIHKRVLPKFETILTTENWKEYYIFLHKLSFCTVLIPIINEFFKKVVLFETDLSKIDPLGELEAYPDIQKELYICILNFIQRFKPRKKGHQKIIKTDENDE